MVLEISQFVYEKYLAFEQSCGPLQNPTSKQISTKAQQHSIQKCCGIWHSPRHAFQDKQSNRGEKKHKHISKQSNALEILQQNRYNSTT